MRTTRIAALVLGTLLASAAAFAAAPVPQTTAAKKTPAATMHVTKGVVKTVGSTSLVIARGSGKKERDMTFLLDASTQRPADIGVGSTVEVRYKGAGTAMTAVKVQPVKQQAAVHKAAVH
jgi:hypothetical protein